jgi:hypothetical protein
MYGWIDFGMGLFYGSYFTLRDQFSSDCYSGLFHTASLLIDVNRVFNWTPIGALNVISASAEPLIAVLVGLNTVNKCINTLNFYESYGEIVDMYFPDWGLELFGIDINAIEEQLEQAEDDSET